jgi:hypothetical protein
LGELLRAFVVHPGELFDFHRLFFLPTPEMKKLFVCTNLFSKFILNY